ncbi:MAG: hypothetical protein ACTHJL_08830 [Amnibacterium sp.]
MLATFLLNPGLSLVIETTTSTAPAPDNGKAQDYLASRILRLREMRALDPEEVSGEDIWNRRDPA